MNSSKMAIIALAVVAALLLAPVCAEQSDAATAGDISLTLPDPESDVVEVTVGNGGSQSFKIFVYNVAKVVKVRTGEVDYDALQDVE